MKNLFRKIIWLPHYMSWLFRYVRLILGFNTLKDIKILSIEFCSVCNLRCRYCFIEKKERPKFLDVALYEKLLKEVCENPNFKVKTMEWPISGEFLIHPDYKKVIEMTRIYMDRHPNFRPHIILNDNMMLMDEEKTNLILKSKTVKQIICSVDGHDAASFERMRPPAKFDKVCHNIRFLAQKNRELGNPVFLQINNGRDSESLGRAYSQDMREIFRLADGVTFWQPKYWNESFNKSEAKFLPAKGFCTFVFNNVTLSASGFVSKCCMDLKGSTDYADLRSHSLEDVWNSKTRRTFLDLMFRNQRHLLEGCKTCSITNTNNDNRYSNVFRALRRSYVRLAGYPKIS